MADRGATALTYGLVVGLVALGSLAAVDQVGNSTSGLFIDVASSIDGTRATPGPAASPSPLPSPSPSPTPTPTPSCALTRVDCQAHRDAGCTDNGTYSLDPDGGGGLSAFTAWCDQATAGGGWTVFQSRESSSNFQQTYATYQGGFGSAGGNHWLGLDRMRALSVHGTGAGELRIEVTYSNEMRHVTYTGFTVGAPSSGYTLAGTHAGGPLGTDFTYHLGRSFSTPEQGGCAASYLGGWWYGSCHSVNINGQWGNTSYGQGLNWHSWTGYYANATRTRMMMR